MPQISLPMIKQLKWIAGLVILTLSATLQAQTKPAALQTPEKPALESKQDRIDLGQELNLTNEQKEALRKIDQDTKTKQREIKKARREELEKVRADRHAAHKALLNAEQAEKYDEIIAQKKARKEAYKAERKAGKKARKDAKPLEKKPASDHK
jgi:Spy/CpxP family protein refolding chaperone